MPLQLALESLWRSRRRNGSALLGLAVGVAAVVAIVTLALVVRSEALRQFDRDGLNVMAVQKTSVTAADAPSRAPGIDLVVVEELPAAIPALDRVAPVLTTRTTIEYVGRQSSLVVVGTTPAFFSINSMPLAAGRRMGDLDRGQPFAVLGRDSAESIGGARLAESFVGQTIVINGRPFTIIGVLADSHAVRLHEGNLNQSIFIPADVHARLLPPGEVDVVYLRLQNAEDPGAAAAAVTRFLQTRIRGLGVAVTSSEQVVADMRRQLHVFAIFLGAAGTLAFILGGLAMLNSLLRSVAERRQEIGLRRALGATQGEIRQQFAWEAGILGAAGGMVGLVGGVALSGAITRWVGWELSVSLPVLSLGFLAAIGVALAAGYFPAWHACRLSPSHVIDPLSRAS